MRRSDFSTISAPTGLSPASVDSMRIDYQSHPYHLTAESPWPLLTAGAILSMLSSAAMWFNHLEHSGTFLTLGMISTTAAMSLWFSDVSQEGTLQGRHTRIVQTCLSMGVSLFIVTEAFFFLSIFWAYFHSSLAPTVELGVQWPPAGITPLSPFSVPLMNTALLLSSGATVTYAHHALFKGSRGATLLGLILTVVLAVVFTALQGMEYDTAGFSMPDGVYGTCFFFSTGFHGIHVIVGTVMLAVGLGRTLIYHFTTGHHMGLEAAILYWH